MKAHRASVQRWLDWLQHAGLVSHTPQQDEEGFWWRTVIELHPCPQLPAELLQDAVERRAGWPERERRREARGRRRDLTAILRRARLSRSERRARAMLRRQLLERHAERQRVRQAVADSLARRSDTSDASLRSLDYVSEFSRRDFSRRNAHRGLTRAPAPVSETATPSHGKHRSPRERQTRTGEETRWAVYNEIVAARFARSDQEWEPLLAAPARRVEELLDWPETVACPRWRLIEAWTIAAHGPHMALAGGFRLAFWSEQAEHHGPRLQRALARYERFSDARPPGWPARPVAALARFLAEPRAPPGRPRARDGLRRAALQRADQADERLRALPARPGAPRTAPRAPPAAPAPASSPSSSTSGCASASASTGRQCGCRPRGSCWTQSTRHTRPPGARCTPAAQRQLRLEQRDERLLAGRHPGDADGRYRAAYRYAQQWGLPLPAGRREETAA